VRYQRRLLSLLSLGVVAAAMAQTPGASPVVSPAPAVGDLLVAPTRIIMDDRTRTAEVTLVNVGAAEATYRVSFLHQRMTETGEMKILEPGEEHPDEQFADNLVRFTPRQVVLQPRVAQTLRLQLRLPEGLSEGEYRSHLLFRAIPEATAPAAPGAVPESKELAIQLRPIYGVSIPLIVRHGQTSSAVTLSDLVLQPSAAPAQPCVLKMRLNRTGSASTYANVMVTLLPAGGGKPVAVGTMGGVAVYTPNPSRLLQLPLTVPAGVKLQGTLKVVYQQDLEQGGAVLAEAALPIP
jgi:P pilus assembly chaperone PapD